MCLINRPAVPRPLPIPTHPTTCNTLPDRALLYPGIQRGKGGRGEGGSRTSIYRRLLYGPRSYATHVQTDQWGCAWACKAIPVGFGLPSALGRTLHCVCVQFESELYPRYCSYRSATSLQLSPRGPLALPRCRSGRRSTKCSTISCISSARPLAIPTKVPQVRHRLSLSKCRNGKLRLQRSHLYGAGGLHFVH